MRFGDVVKIKREQVCPLTGFPKGTVGAVINFYKPTNKYRVAIGFNKHTGYNAWWYFEDDLEYMGKNIAIKNEL